MAGSEYPFDEGNVASAVAVNNVIGSLFWFDTFLGSAMINHAESGTNAASFTTLKSVIVSGGTFHDWILVIADQNHYEGASQGWDDRTYTSSLRCELDNGSPNGTGTTYATGSRTCVFYRNFGAGDQTHFTTTATLYMRTFKDGVSGVNLGSDLTIDIDGKIDDVGCYIQNSFLGIFGV